MVLFYTHLLIGIIVFLSTKDFFSGGNQLIFFFMLLLGSLLPDVDEQRSRINHWSGIIGIVIAFFSKHRGFFHSLLFFALSFVLVDFLWNFYYATALFLGYFAHLIGDGITRRGVYIFYPFSDFKIKGPVKVGGILEIIVWLILALLIVKEFI
ncbi:MAG: metal-dependent hydrolase [Nanoarchaeota archaeon]